MIDSSASQTVQLSLLMTASSMSSRRCTHRPLLSVTGGGAGERGAGEGGGRGGGGSGVRGRRPICLVSRQPKALTEYSYNNGHSSLTATVRAIITQTNI